MTANPEQQTELPEDLVDALRRADPPPAIVTRRVDRHLARLAAAQFGRRRRSRLRQPAPLFAAAATLLVTVTVVVLNQRPAPDHEVAATQVGVYADVDGSGRIDIADVMALARDSGSVSDEALEAFARQVVRLDDGETS